MSRGRKKRASLEEPPQIPDATAVAKGNHESPLLKFYKVCFWLSCLLCMLALIGGLYRSLAENARLPTVAIDYEHYIKNLFSAQDYRQAVNQLKIAAEIDKNRQVPLLLNLIRAAREANDLDSEIDALKKLRESGNATAYDYADLASALMRRSADRDEIKEAMQSGVDAVNIDPKSDVAAKAHLIVVEGYLKLGRADKAEIHLKAALEIDPQMSQAQPFVQYFSQLKKQQNRPGQQ